jgi:glycosyltransferase involved in cell wall biosynthesis
MTFWYDFTTTMRNRSRNGIAAAEWSLGTALLDAEPTTRAFVLRERHGLVPIDAQIELSGALYASPGADVAPGNEVRPTWRGRARVALDASLGQYATPVVRLLSQIYHLPRRAARAVSKTLRGAVGPIADSALADRVAAGDVVISMGADWSGELAERLLQLKRRTGCRVVTMVYDVIPLTHNHLAFHNDPEHFAAYYCRLASVSDLITCISEQSRADLRRVAHERGWALPTIKVLRLGEAAPAEPSDAVDREDFYLWVGTIERRKNLELIYDALRIIESEGGQVPTVVVAGGVGWGVDDLLAELAQQSTAASRAIVLLGAVDETTLDSLYRRARALLFPSHYEGWGLPVREAAVRGCPVAAGDSPAVREAILGYAGGQLLPVDDPGPWADY